MIQGVLFDLFETLVTESHASIQRASSLASRLGVNEDAYRRLWRSRRPDVMLGRATFREALAHIARTLGLSPADSLLHDIRSQRTPEHAAVAGRSPCWSARTLTPGVGTFSGNSEPPPQLSAHGRSNQTDIASQDPTPRGICRGSTGWRTYRIASCSTPPMSPTASRWTSP